MCSALTGDRTAGPGGGPAPDVRVAQVREFGRFWERDVVARLDDSLAGSTYSPAEARVVFDLADTGRSDLAGLRSGCGLECRQLIRVVHRLRNEGVLDVRPAAGPGGPVVGLTARGREVLALLDRQIAEHARSILAGLREERQRDVVAAMATIRRALSGEVGRPFTLRGPRPGDLGWVVQRHGAVYAEEYGWDQRFEGDVADLVAGFAARRDPARERVWIAEVDGAPAGCVFCLDAEAGGTDSTWTADGAARLGLLLVDPAARGLGIGWRLVGECLAFARQAGYRKVLLRTEEVFTSARRIVEAYGFEPGDERPQLRYGRILRGQHWVLPLTVTGAG